MKNLLLLLLCVFAVACTSEKITNANASCCKPKNAGHYTQKAGPNSAETQKARYILSPKVKKTWHDWRHGNEGC